MTHPDIKPEYVEKWIWILDFGVGVSKREKTEHGHQEMLELSIKNGSIESGSKVNKPK